MANSRVRKLLFRGEGRWLIVALITFISAGIAAGVISVDNFWDMGNKASPILNQYFIKNSFSVRNVLMQKEIKVSDSLYIIAILFGTLLIFWGRRTHYFEFLLNLGTTRLQIFKAQLWFGISIVSVGTLLAEFFEYLLIRLFIPANYLRYFPYSGLVGQAFTVMSLSLMLFSLGILMANLSDNIIVALLGGFLIWRPIFNLFTERSEPIVLIGKETLYRWFRLHPIEATGVNVLSALVLLIIGALLFRYWSADRDGQIFIFPKLMVIYIIIGAFGIGTLFGEAFLWTVESFDTDAQLLGVVVALIIESIWFICWWLKSRYRGHHNES